MHKYLILASVILSVWKVVRQIRRDRFLEQLNVAQASLAAAVFGTQGTSTAPATGPSSSQHLPRTLQRAQSASLSRRSRTLQREPTARDWTVVEAAAQAAAGALPAGFQRHRTSLRATAALQPYNETIPLLLLWHESFLPDGLAAFDTPDGNIAGVPSGGAPAAEAVPQTSTGDAGGAPPGSAARRLPVVIWLHATGQCMADMVPRMEAFARRGFLTAAVDSRYHGERTDPNSSCSQRVQYEDALYRAWSNGNERPFLLDNVRDLSAVLDYLSAHPNVDPERIGMAGVSLGGMHTWLCAAIDPRVAAAAPMIGVHSFQWHLSNDAFHGRVDSLKHAFQQICCECGKDRVDAAVVQNVWHRLLPGLLEDYDAHKSLPCIAPRPLLIVNGELDPRCKAEGLPAIFAECQRAYTHWGCRDNLEMHIEVGAGHEVTASMDEVVLRFFAKHLLPA